MTEPGRVVLVRHAQTEWSANGRHTGRTDLPLTGDGESAARALAPALGGHAFAAVWSSPLSRAVRTCELTGLAPTALRAELLEWDYGDYEGLTTPQIREHRPGWNLWRDGCPGGETAADVGARVDVIVGELAAAAIGGEPRVLFAHGHVLRVLAARWIGLTPADGSLLALSTTSISQLGFEREQRVIWRWNETFTAP